jgi:hypothetical protein
MPEHRFSTLRASNRPTVASDVAGESCEPAAEIVTYSTAPRRRLTVTYCDCRVAARSLPSVERGDAERPSAARPRSGRWRRRGVVEEDLCRRLERRAVVVVPPSFAAVVRIAVFFSEILY